MGNIRDFIVVHVDRSDARNTQHHIVEAESAEEALISYVSEIGYQSGEDFMKYELENNQQLLIEDDCIKMAGEQEDYYVFIRD